MLSKKFEKPKEDKEIINVEELILKGGSAPADAQTENSRELRFSLRIPYDILNKMEKVRKAQGGFISRNTWILQAILEKLEQTKD